MKQLKAQTAIFISSFFYLFISSFVIHATVILNEVAIQPNQMVEVYNTASTSADISGWYIDDSGGTTYYTVPQQTIIAPLSCYVFTADFNFNKSSADVVRLFDNSSPPTSSPAGLLETYVYSKAPDIGYSFVKIIDGGSEWQTSSSSLGLLNETLTSCIPSLTPTPFPTETPTPTPTLTPAPTLAPSTNPYSLTPSPSPIDYSNVFISEVFPYPAVNENEWIELYNNNDFKVCLEKWYIDDGENTGSTPKQISLCLESFSYGSIDITSSLFNNNGDTVRLLNAEKTEKDSTEFGKITQGKSMGRISIENNEYCEQEPSKNTVNNSCIVLAVIKEQSQTSTQVSNQIDKTKTLTKAVSSRSLNTQSSSMNSTRFPPTPQYGEVLGTESEEISLTNPSSPSPIPYLSSVSFSYSLLTIVSIFIKMKNA